MKEALEFCGIVFLIGTILAMAFMFIASIDHVQHMNEHHADPVCVQEDIP